jgi:hypothetical protein
MGTCLDGAEAITKAFSPDGVAAFRQTNGMAPIAVRSRLLVGLSAYHAVVSSGNVGSMCMAIGALQLEKVGKGWRHG